MTLILTLVVVGVVAFLLYKNFTPKAAVKVEAKPVVAEAKVEAPKVEAKAKAPAKKTAAKKPSTRKTKAK